MNTREIALNIFENLSQDELEAFVILFGKGFTKTEKRSPQEVYGTPLPIPI